MTKIIPISSLWITLNLQLKFHNHNFSSPLNFEILLPIYPPKPPKKQVEQFSHPKNPKESIRKNQKYLKSQVKKSLVIFQIYCRVKLRDKNKNLQNGKNMPIEYIAFDADDTLWHNEMVFRVSHQKFWEIISPYMDKELSPKEARMQIYDREIANLHIFGYGVKSFTLSLIETALELSQETISASDIQRLLNLGKIMLEHPVKLLDNVESVVKKLSNDYKLLIITKGNLFDQESKIARSGLADYFDIIEVVSEKDKETYSNIFSKHNIKPNNLIMIGNSLKSDVLPIIEAGGNAVHLPYDTTSLHERVSLKNGKWPKKAYKLNHIKDFPNFIENFCQLS